MKQNSRRPADAELNGNAIPVLATVSITFVVNKDGSPEIIPFIG